MKNPNFLILDEPTNDLDIATLEVLEDYLHDFAGCVMVVSHDRYFLDEVVDHVFVFRGEGKVKDYPGNYSQYFEWEEKQKKEVKVAPEKKEKPKSLSSQRKKLSYKEKLEYENLESEIAELESEKSEIETLLNSGTLDNNDLQVKSERIGELLEIIDEKSMRWLELAERSGM